MASHPLTFNEALKGILDFIEVAVHTILYVRQVYPADLFVRRRKFDTPVFQSRHPALNDYISGAVKAVGEEMASGKVDKVVVVIKDQDNNPLERFIFAVENMISPESFNKDTSVENAMATTALGLYFRSFLVKLTMIEAHLGQMFLGGRWHPQDSCLERISIDEDELSFAIVLELKDDKIPTAGSGKCEKDVPPWIPAIPEHTTSGAQKKAELHPIRAVNTGVINLSLSVQESQVKLRKMKPPAVPKPGAELQPMQAPQQQQPGVQPQQHAEPGTLPDNPQGESTRPENQNEAQHNLQARSRQTLQKEQHQAKSDAANPVEGTRAATKPILPQTNPIDPVVPKSN